jgi:hypothetical protein
MLLALGLMGAGGYQKYQQNQQDLADAQADREFKAKERQRMTDLWARDDKLRSDIAAAGKPAAVQNGATVAGIASAPATYDDADVAASDARQVRQAALATGTDAPAVSVTPTAVVNGQAYGDTAAAKTAADAYNKPGARAQRTYDALVANGQINQAEDLRAKTTQGDLAGLQLDAAKQARLDDAYNRDLMAKVPLNDWGALEKFVNDTKGDGRGGGLKVKLVKSDDGKTVTVHKVGDDGSTSPMAQVANTPEGFAGLVRGAVMQLSPESKLQHVIDTAKTTEDRRRWEAEFGVKQTESQARITAENRRASAEERRATADERRANLAEKALDVKKSGIVDRMSEVDKVQFGNLAKQAETINSAIAKSQAEGMWNPDSPGSKQLMERQATISGMMAKLVSQYDDSASDADPLGIMGKGSAPAKPPAKAKEPPPVVPARASMAAAAPLVAAAAPAAPDPATIRQQRIQEITRQLATDDTIKSGGLGGMGMRAVQAGALPLGIGGRRALEEELANLQTGK